MGQRRDQVITRRGTVLLELQRAHQRLRKGQIEFVTLSHVSESGCTTGIPVSVSAHWIVLRTLGDSQIFDGFCALSVEGITSLLSNSDRALFGIRFLNTLSNFPAIKPVEIPYTAQLGLIINTFGGGQLLIGIYTKKKNRTIYYIGALQSVSQKTIRLKTLSQIAKWEAQWTKVDNKSVHRIDFDTGYLNAYQTVVRSNLLTGLTKSNPNVVDVHCRKTPYTVSGIIVAKNESLVVIRQFNNDLYLDGFCLFRLSNVTKLSKTFALKQVFDTLVQEVPSAPIDLVLRAGDSIVEFLKLMKRRSEVVSISYQYKHPGEATFGKITEVSKFAVKVHTLELTAEWGEVEELDIKDITEIEWQSGYIKNLVSLNQKL